MSKLLYFHKGPEGYELSGATLRVPSPDPQVIARVQADIVNTAFKNHVFKPGESAPLELKVLALICGGVRASGLPYSIAFQPAVMAGYTIIDATEGAPIQSN